MLEVRRISSAETRPLRLKVLRPGRPAESAIFDGDDDPDTVHFGGFLEGRLVAIASLYLRGRSPKQQGAWQLRGMAVEPELQGRGHGSALVDACLAHARARAGSLVWCNARKHAVPFYLRHGFVVASDELDIPDVGPHFVMERPLG